MNESDFRLENRSYNSIDLFKFIMSIFVVAIHTHPLEWCTNDVFNTVYLGIVSIAVPFFFIASGFLLASKLKYPYDSKEDIDVIKKYLKKIIKMYVIWTILYFPLTIYAYQISETPFIISFVSFTRAFFDWTALQFLDVMVFVINDLLNNVSICFAKKAFFTKDNFMDRICVDYNRLCIDRTYEI